MKNATWYYAIVSGAMVLCLALCGVLYADIARRGDPTGTVTWVKAPGDFADISWAAVPVPNDAVQSASPERLEIAADMLASMLSDPTFRTREEASAMAKGQAAQIGYAFADALVRVAAE